nr:MFS transporter [Streptomyces sp. S1D4-11]QIZ00879.1 MFS transporter [Streptomyces sp. S1D4-11]
MPLFPGYLNGPARQLAVLHGVDGIGVGLYMAGSAVYLTEVTGLSPAQIGVALSAAAATGLLASVLFGAVADRTGARPLLAWLLAGLGCGYLVLPAVHTAWQFVLLSVALGALQFGTGPSFMSLIAELVPEGDRARARAAIRSAGNTGMGLGTLAAVALLAVSSHGALQVIPLANGVTFVAAALLVRLPAAPAWPPTASRRCAICRSCGSSPSTRCCRCTTRSWRWPSRCGSSLKHRPARRAHPAADRPQHRHVRTAPGAGGPRQRRPARRGPPRPPRGPGLSAVSCLLLVPSGHLGLLAAGALVCTAFVVMTGAELWHAA